MEAPIQISWICYGCFETVHSYLGRAAPCMNCEPTVHEDDAEEYHPSRSGFWVNATGIEVTSKSDPIEQDAVWEEYDLRMELLEQDWDETMGDDDGW